MKILKILLVSPIILSLIIGTAYPQELVVKPQENPTEQYNIVMTKEMSDQNSIIAEEDDLPMFWRSFWHKKMAERMMHASPMGSDYLRRQTPGNSFIYGAKQRNYALLSGHSAPLQKPTSVISRSDFTRIFGEAKAELDLFNASGTGQSYGLYEGYELKKISPDDPGVKEMIEKAKDDIIERLGLDESERDKIKVVAIEPGGFDKILEPIERFPDYKMDVVYDKLAEGVVYAGMYNNNMARSMSSVSQNEDRSLTWQILSKDPSVLINEILGGKLADLATALNASRQTMLASASGSNASQADSFNAMKSESSMPPPPAEAATRRVENFDEPESGFMPFSEDLESLFMSVKIKPFISPIVVPFRPFYDYKIILSYTADESDPNRQETGFEYLVAGGELMISLFKNSEYRDDKLAKETTYSYDWNGVITQTKITNFEYDNKDRLKKAISEVFDNGNRLSMSITIKYKYFGNTSLIKKKIVETKYYWGQDEPALSTISEYEYERWGDDTRLIYHVEKTKDETQDGSDYLITLEEFFTYTGDKLTKLTRKRYSGNELYSLETEEYEYHAAGNLAKKTITTDYYYGGGISYRYINILEYDASDRIVLQEYRQYRGEDDLLYMYRYKWTYDGDLLIKHTEERLIYGKLVAILEQTYKYENGNEIEYIEKILNHENELAISYKRIREYDAVIGKIKKEINEYYDYYKSGLLTRKDVTTYEYTGELLEKSVREEYALVGEGDVNARTLVLRFRRVTEYHYDPNNFNYKIIYIVTAFDASGEVEIWVETETKEYIETTEGLRRLVSRTVVRDVFEDGNLIERTKERYDYDDLGRNVYYEKATFDIVYGNEVLRNFDAVTYIYDGNMLVEKIAEEKICANNGELLEWSKETTKFDQHGRVISFIKEEFDASGATIAKSGYEKGYDPETGLLIRHADLDLVNGEFVITYEATYEYNENRQKTRFTEKVYDEIKGELVNKYQELYAYDEDWRMTSKLEMMPDRDGNFKKHREYIWKYEDGRVVRYAEKDRDNFGNFSLTKEIRYGYDDAGRQTFYSDTTWDLNNNVTCAFSWTKEYNENGRLIRHVENRRDGTKRIRTDAYDDQDRQTNYSEKVLKASGAVDSWFTWEKEYHENGKPSYYAECRLSPAGILSMTYENIYDYDDEGRRTLYIVKEWDNSLGHALTDIYEERKQYGEHGIVYEFTKELSMGTGHEEEKTLTYDKDGNKKTEVVIYRIYRKGMLYTETIDIYDYKKGTLITHNYDFKEFANGEIKIWNGTVREYNDKGWLILLTQKEYDVDGNLLDWRTIQYAHDKDTGLCISETKRNYHGDKLISKLVTTFKYDDNGNVIQKNVKTFNSASGLTSEDVYEMEYDSQNRKTTEERKKYSLGGFTDGAMTYWSLYNWAYGDNGYWKQTFEQKWFDGLGQITRWTVRTEERIPGEHGGLRRYIDETLDKSGDMLSRNTSEYGYYGRHEDGKYRRALTLESREEMDNVTGELVEVYRYEATYEKFGSVFKLLEETVKERISGELVITKQDTRVYDAAGRILLRTIKERLSGELVIISRDTREYNSAGNILLCKIEERVGEELIETQRDTYTYDEQERCTMRETWKRINGELLIVYRSTYGYDDHGRRILHVREERINGDFVVIYKETYEYDEENRCVLHEIHKRLSGELAVVEREERSYDEGCGKLTLYRLQRLDENSGELVDILVDEYRYDTAGRKTYYSKKVRKDGALFTVFEEEIEYDENGIKTYHKEVRNESEVTIRQFNHGGKLLRYEEQLLVDGVSVTQLRRTYEYDSENRMTMKKIEELDGEGNLETTLVLIYRYDGQSRLLHYEKEEYENNKITSRYILDYTYDSLGRLRGLVMEGQIYEDGIYQGSAWVSFEYNKKGQLENYIERISILGELIYENEITYVYKSNGNKSTQVETETSYNAETGERSKEVTSYTFDNDGEVAKYDYKRFNLLDEGDVLLERVVVEFTYDARGEKVWQQTTEYIYDDEGTYQGKVEEECNYNAEGRISDMATRTYDENGILISEISVTYEYDDNGNRILVIGKELFDENKEKLRTTLKKYMLDGNGDLVLIEEGEYDENGDPVDGESEEVASRRAIEAKVSAQSKNTLFTSEMAENKSLIKQLLK